MGGTLKYRERLKAYVIVVAKQSGRSTFFFIWREEQQLPAFLPNVQSAFCISSRSQRHLFSAASSQIPQLSEPVIETLRRCLATAASSRDQTPVSQIMARRPSNCKLSFKHKTVITVTTMIRTFWVYCGQVLANAFSMVPLPKSTTFDSDHVPWTLLARLTYKATPCSQISRKWSKTSGPNLSYVATGEAVIWELFQITSTHWKNGNKRQINFKFYKSSYQCKQNAPTKFLYWIESTIDQSAGTQNFFGIYLGYVVWMTAWAWEDHRL